MKAAILYHSHYGNTSYIVRLFREAISGKVSTEVLQLQYAGGKKNMLQRLAYRFMPSLVKLKPVTVDLKDFDIIFFGIAVMGGYPSSVMAKYMHICKNIANKKIVCCYVYSVQASMETCRGYVDEILNAKGAQPYINLEVPWSRVLDKKFLDTLIADAIAKLIA